LFQLGGRKLDKTSFILHVRYLESFVNTASGYTDKKENKIFLIYREIKMGSGAKSYMRKGFLILYMRKCTNIFTIYMRRPLDFAPDPSEFPNK
jgi:hypothetical protein